MQGFSIERVARRDLNPATYNPRTSTKVEDANLEQSLRKNKLVETLVYNKRTRTLVGGHRRLKSIDTIEGSLEYSLDVAVVDLDEKQEKALNVLLNNQSNQGAYDLDKLSEMFTEISPESMGFAPMDLEVMYDGAGIEFPSVLSQIEPHEPPAVKNDLDELEKISALKRRRKEYQAEAKSEDDARFITIITWGSNEERESFNERIEQNPGERYIDGTAVMAHLTKVS